MLSSLCDKDLGGRYNSTKRGPGMSDRGVIQRLIISISHPPGNSDQRSRFLWHSQPDPRAHLFPFVRPPPSPRSPQDKQHGCKAIGDILRWLHRTETDSISFDCSSKRRLKFLLQLFSGKGKALCNCQIYTGPYYWYTYLSPRN